MTVDKGNKSTEVVEKISTEVLRMNFMKRTTVRLEKHQRAQQQQKAREDIFTGIMAVDPPKYYPTAEHIDDDPNWTLGGVMSEWRYTVLENMRFGRFSFKGQNPEVEKLMEFHERRRLCLPDLDPKNSDDEENVDGSDSSEEGQISEEDEKPTYLSTERKRKGNFENAGKKTFENSNKKRKWDGGRHFKVTGRILRSRSTSRELRDSQTDCTDTECTTGTGDPSCAGSNMMLIAMAWGLFAMMMFFMRPASMRSGGSNTEEQSEGKPSVSSSDNNPPPPPGDVF
uniref:Small integral membrane protein 14 n=1 Tax=Meloidogyne javanica TaxID=6303 RepID=A0A915LGJ3_MELJA